MKELNMTEQTRSRRFPMKTAKALLILTVFAAWFFFTVVVCGKNRVSSIPPGTWVDSLLKRFPDTFSTKTIHYYLSQGGMMLSAFYLTVLVPDTLKRFFPENRRVLLSAHVITGILLLSGAVCCIAGCLPVHYGLSGRLASVLGYQAWRKLQYVNTMLTPVTLLLAFVTWFLPAAAAYLQALRKGKSLRPATRSIAVYLLLAAIVPLWCWMAESMYVVLRPLYDSGGIRANEYESVRFYSAFFTSVVLAPVIEEVFFRGLIEGHLKTVLPVWISIAISSVMFGLWHGNLFQIIYTSFSGLMMGIVYAGTGKLRHTVFLHFGNNMYVAMANSTSPQSLLGKLTVTPAVCRWFGNLPYLPAVIVSVILILLILAALDAVLTLSSGRKPPEY